MTHEQTEVHSPDQGSDEQSTEMQHRQYLLQVLSKEMELIGGAILDRNRQSTQIKQWCLTLWLAAWGVLSVDYVRGLFQDWQYIPLLAPLVFPPFFFWVSLINKRRERKLTYRARLIHTFLNADYISGESCSCSLRTFIEKGEIGNFRFYDPAAMNWLHQPGGPIGDRSIEEMDKWLSFGNVIRESWGYAVFYGILTVISIVPFAVVMLMLLFLDESITGKVTDVIDGDTIKVGYMKIEFDGVWVPDLSNPLGKQAKKSMNQLVAGIQVTCKLTNTKSKQHRFGTCFLPDKTNLSAEIISSGLARDCPRHSGGRYQKFETEKNKRLSLPDYC